MSTLLCRRVRLGGLSALHAARCPLVSPPSPSAALCRRLLLQQHCVAAFSFSSTVSPPSPSAALCRRLLQQHCVTAFSFSSTVSPPSSAALCRRLLLQQHCVAAFSFSSTVSPPSSAALCTGAVRPTPPSEPGCCLSASVLLVVRQNRSPGVSRCRFTDLRRVVFDGAVVQGDPSTHSTRSPISTNQRR